MLPWLCMGQKEVLHSIRTAAAAVAAPEYKYSSKF